jgi:hypothetical protein
LIFRGVRRCGLRLLDVPSRCLQQGCSKRRWRQQVDRIAQILDDQVAVVLFEKELFEVFDSYEHPTWVKEGPFDDGDYYVDPPECGRPGFYERWHDGDRLAREIFAKVFASLVAEDERRR